MKVAEEIPYMYSILCVNNYPWKSVTGDMDFDRYIASKTHNAMSSVMSGLSNAVHVSITREFYANGN